MSIAIVRSVHVGLAAPLGPQGVPSGFIKPATQDAVPVHELGLEGDQQADLRVHGGPEKAVYGYATAHYDAWRRDFLLHQRARQRHDRNDHQKSANERGKTDREVVPAVGTQAGKSGAVVSGGGSKGVQHLRQSVRAGVS